MDSYIHTTGDLSLQTTVCKTVKKHLKTLYPGAISHDFLFCVQCQKSKTHKECRFKREYNCFVQQPSQFLKSLKASISSHCRDLPLSSLFQIFLRKMLHKPFLPYGIKI